MSIKLQILVFIGLLASAAFADDAIPVYRSYHSTGDHLYSLSAYEGPQNGYRDEGIAFYVSTRRSSYSPTAIYRCFTGRKHFVSTDRYCEGQRREGIYGYIARRPFSGFVALNRYNNPGNGDHIVTSGENESLAGFVFETTLGYAIPGNF